ncbi:ABC-type glycerol-3-phosphate transport system substrate-binding protein [Catenulispora sp. GP43]|uniref:hypothetical protein n=1 Tax=Catenulispora sp. GP43 TaxID=3156263 RepID=UPI003512C1DE
MPVPARDRFPARSAACLVAIVLGLGAAACSASTSPTPAESSSQQTSAQPAAAVPPDPCKLLGTAQVSAAFSQSSNHYVASLAWNALEA